MPSTFYGRIEDMAAKISVEIKNHGLVVDKHEGPTMMSVHVKNTIESQPIFHFWITCY